MGALTKVILVLLVVALAVGALFIASRDWSDLGTYRSLGPAAVRTTAEDAVRYADPIAMYRRWRQRLGRGERAPKEGASARDEGGSAAPESGEPPAPPSSSPSSRAGGAVPMPAPESIDLSSTSRDEGTIVAGAVEQEVAGADPPGPVLRPQGVEGEVVTGPLRVRAAAPENTYVVRAGDTLYEIAVAKYGDPKFVQAIQEANPGLDPTRLQVGQRIVLPPRAAATARSPAKPRRPKVYVVKRGDTLIGIARKIYGDGAMYPKIYQANKDILSSLNARLYPGMRLRLPEPE